MFNRLQATKDTANDLMSNYLIISYRSQNTENTVLLKLQPGSTSKPILC